jgi:hypothetical protein
MIHLGQTPVTETVTETMTETFLIETVPSEDPLVEVTGGVRSLCLRTP